ncbi:MAG TPA: ATP-binding cassette domain-containing protein [Candidatus Dormibacteraeota bacterium]|nr:ATP-binding cassette domain-containing protein [Candidatus Dormibacteraeota bacterium]
MAAEERLIVSNVTVTFGGLTALEDVSLTVEPGEIVGVIGPNGAGKTTLLNAICGFVRPRSGSIVYRGRELRRHRPHDLTRLGIARTLQGLGLWRGLNVIENVVAGGQGSVRADPGSALLGLPRSVGEEARLRARARALLAELRLEADAERPPGVLPYGLQKRVALGRALMAEPSLLLLDEPASGLSEAEMEDLRSLLLGLRSRMGVLLIEHHMDLVMSTCDRLVVLDFGRVIASGTPEVIRADPQVTTAYLGEVVTGSEAGGAGG